VRSAWARIVLGSTALAVAALIAQGGAVASASACKRWGADDPATLSREHARAATTCFINRVRTKKGRQPLSTNDQLQQAAQAHTDYMKKKDCFQHTCKNEPALEKRLRQAHYLDDQYTSWAAGENIAYGGAELGTPKAIFKAWMGSSGHRANILDPGFRDLGVGFDAASSFKRAHQDAGIYTTDFGDRHR
jgi:uncharacterized protein YkwD